MRRQMNIGGYTLIKRIGSGGMSTVFEAEDGQGARVALKLLHPALMADGGRERLRREVATLLKVRGAYVAEVLDAETEGNEAFVVTELIDGPTLEQDVIDSGVFDGQDLVDLAKRLKEAVEAIHRVGVLHRDLKPSNVMLGPDGPVLIDFGIAQVDEDSRLTVPGSVAHTPGYCDPRVINGGDPDETADWWALAAVLTFAATGRAPFGKGNPQTIMHKVFEGEPDVVGLSSPVALAFARALSPEVGGRIGIDELIDVLQVNASFAGPAAVAGGAFESAATYGGATLPPPEDITRERPAEVPGRAGATTADTAAQTSFTASDDRAVENATEVLASGVTATQVLGSGTEGLPGGEVPTSADRTEVLDYPRPGGWASDAGGPEAALRLRPGQQGIPPTEALPIGEAAQQTSPATEILPNASGAGRAEPPPSFDAARNVDAAHRFEAPQNFGHADDANSQVTERIPSPLQIQPQLRESSPANAYPAPWGEELRSEEATIPAWLRPAPRARFLVFLAGVALLSVTVRFPLIGIVMYAILALLLGVVGASHTALNRRRHERGGKYPHEKWGVVFRLPAILLQTLVTQALCLAIGAGAGLAATWGLSFAVPNEPRLGTLVGGIIALTFSWLNGLNEPARLGARKVLAAIAPESPYKFFWAVIFIVLAALGTLYSSSRAFPEWMPLSEEPVFLRH